MGTEMRVACPQSAGSQYENFTQGITDAQCHFISRREHRGTCILVSLRRSVRARAARAAPSSDSLLATPLALEHEREELCELALLRG